MFRRRGGLSEVSWYVAIPNLDDYPALVTLHRGPPSVLTQRTCDRLHRWITIHSPVDRADTKPERLCCLRPYLLEVGNGMSRNTFAPPLREPLQNRSMRPILRLALRSRDLRTRASLPPRLSELSSMPKLRAKLAHPRLAPRGRAPRTLVEPWKNLLPTFCRARAPIEGLPLAPCRVQ